MLHSKRFSVLTMFVIAALLLSACQPVVASPATEPPPPQGLRPDAPPYAVQGPYAVGVRDFVIEGTSEYTRPLTVSVWYPALNPGGQPDEITYKMDLTPGGEFSAMPVYGHAIQDAEPAAAGAPFPIVLFSHGGYTFRQSATYLVEHLASQGFVVIAPDHFDNWGTFPQPTHAAEIYRPIELRRTLDYAEKLTADDEALKGLIDMERVAAAGWSFGGEEAMILGGARFNLDEFFAGCAAEEDLSADCVYRDVVDEMAKLAGLDAPPQGLWPDWSDPRIDAVVALAPGSHLFGKTGTQAMRVPTLLITGTDDEDVGTGIEYFDTYQRLPSARKSQVTFEDADHMIFFNTCDANPGFVDLGFPFFCSNPVWDMDRAHDLINHFVTSFLQSELKGDPDAAKALAPENVSFPGIQYETTAYGASSTAEPGATATLPAGTISQIEALVEKTMTANKIPGFALGIVKDGKIVYTKGFGVERVGTDRPVTTHTVFGTGSVGKTATATAIMQLVDAGKIDLDAPVTDYLPYFKLADERYKDITVRHLITHRSGLPDVEEWFPLPVEYDDGALERYIRTLDKVELLFAPGEEWSYSGMGFTMLADIVAKVSGQSFEDYLHEHITQPLGMDDTLLIVQAADQAQMASPHVRNDAQKVAVSDIFPYRRQFTATGPLYSSIMDMTRYAAAHLNQGEFEGTRILPAVAYDAMWEPISKVDIDFGPAINPAFSGYGMGWTLGEIDGHRMSEHFGLDEGYTAAMMLAPDDNVAVVTISNYFDDEEFNLFAWETAVETMRTLLKNGQ